jgi:hypothetical protein
MKESGDIKTYKSHTQHALNALSVLTSVHLPFRSLGGWTPIVLLSLSCFELFIYEYRDERSERNGRVRTSARGVTWARSRGD